MSYDVRFKTTPPMKDADIKKMMVDIYKKSGVDPDREGLSDEELFTLGKRGEFSVDVYDVDSVRKYLKRKRIKFTDNGYGGTEDMDVEQLVSRVVCGGDASAVLESAITEATSLDYLTFTSKDVSAAERFVKQIADQLGARVSEQPHPYKTTSGVTKGLPILFSTVSSPYGTEIEDEHNLAITFGKQENFKGSLNKKGMSVPNSDLVVFITHSSGYEGNRRKGDLPRSARYLKSMAEIKKLWG